MADAEKTEQATDRKVEEFRDKGKIPSSRELMAALAMCAGFGSLVAAFPMLSAAVATVTTTLHTLIPDGELTPPEVVYTFGLVTFVALPPVVLILSAPMAVSILGGVVMSGFNLSTQPLMPDMSRLNPMSNFKATFFSITPFVSLAKGVLVAGAMVWAVWAGVREHLPMLPVLARIPLGAQLANGAAIVSSILERALPSAVAIGALDFIYQRWKMGEDMKMSKQEVKEEHKDSDGDPQMKAKRRSRARAIATGSAIQNVRKADVVVTNPTHYAVALRYRKEENAAPVVVAKGTDEIALNIRAEAGRNDILVVENRPLARALFAKSKAGLPIPREFYQPVAQVLALVYRRRRGLAAPPPRSPMP